MVLPTLASGPGGTPPESSEAEKTQQLPPVDTRRLEVLEAYENLAARTHFEVLGVPSDAREAQVREAYFRLAKRFHPDVHHDPALSDLREQLEEVFGRLGEAYEVLCSPRLRARYEKLLAEQLAAPPAPARRDPEEEAALAAEAIEKGAESIVQERYSEAIQQLEPAISRAQGEARSRARVLLARAYAEDPNWVKQGEELLLSVLLEEPENDDALLLLGRIYAGLGLRSRAVATLGRVLDRHPDHEEVRGLIKEIERASSLPGEGAARLKKLLARKPR
jgi:tetratricopeptide (TPR) repeat protein